MAALDKEDKFDPADLEFVGTVTHVQGEEAESKFCRIRPVYREFNHSWVPLTKTPSLFPDIGLVFWWRPNLAVNKGTYLRFSLADSQYYEIGKRYDRYQIKNGTVSVLIEAEKRSITCDLVELRRMIAAGRLSATVSPIGDLFIRIAATSSHWIGPFTERDISTLDKVEPSLACDNSTGFIRLYHIDERMLQLIHIHDGEHLLLRPRLQLPSPIGYFNTESDAELVKALAMLVRRQESPIEAARLMRKRTVHEAIDILSVGDDATRDRSRDAARLEAALALNKDLEMDEEEEQKVKLFLKRLPLVEEIRAELRAAYEQQHAAEFVKRREDAQAALDAESFNSKQELAEVRAEIAVLRSAEEQTITQTKAALASVIENAAARIAEHAVIRRVGTSLLNRSLERHDNGTTAPSLRASSLNDISDHAISVANFRGEDTYIVNVMTAIMAGSQMTLVAGVRAFGLAVTVARCLGGGGACVVPIAPTMFSLRDLMNAACASVSRLPCHAASLFEFISNAMHQQELSIVILQGINRAPPENVLLELAELAAEEDQDNQFRWRDFDGVLQQVRLDKRVLFLATLTTGSATFQISRELGARLPLIYSDRRVLPGTTKATQEAPPALSVPFEVWQPADLYTCNEQGPTISKLTSLPQYDALTPFIGKYLKRVCGMLGSEEVGLAEGIWALTCGRLEDKMLKEVATCFSAQQAGLLSAAIERGDSRKVRRYFDYGQER
jgi:hypothetical protein